MVRLELRGCASTDFPATLMGGMACCAADLFPSTFGPYIIPYFTFIAEARLLLVTFVPSESFFKSTATDRPGGGVRPFFPFPDCFLPLVIVIVFLVLSSGAYSRLVERLSPSRSSGPELDSTFLFLLDRRTTPSFFAEALGVLVLSDARTGSAVRLQGAGHLDRNVIRSFRCF
jgi:hypothetical protein